MQTPQPPNSEGVTVFQLCLLLLSIIVILTLVIDTVAPVPREVSRILQSLDNVACALFFVDFVLRLKRAESRASFMRWGWIDLIACIPNVDVLRVGRMVRVLRIIRLLRGVRVGHRIVSVILQNKPKSAFASVFLTSLLLITFSSVAILIAEDEKESNIKTANDAIWWSITTMTTVGYGDKYPITVEGRAVAIILMLAGVGLFGTLSGIVASLFIGTKNTDEATELKEIIARLRSIEERLNIEKPEFPAIPDSSGIDAGNGKTGASSSL